MTEKPSSKHFTQAACVGLLMTEHNPVSVYLMFHPEITSPARRLLQCSSVVRTPAREAIDPLKIKIKIKNKDQTQFALGVKAPNLIKVME